LASAAGSRTPIAACLASIAAIRVLSLAFSTASSASVREIDVDSTSAIFCPASTLSPGRTKTLLTRVSRYGAPTAMRSRVTIPEAFSSTTPPESR
jgi:hypothetical protein